MIPEITLIYFGACQNYKNVKNLLVHIGVAFNEINQDDLVNGHPFKLFTSPTILKNDYLIFGERIDSAGGGCSIRIPKREELEQKLANDTCES